MILIHSIPCVNGAHKPSSLPVLVMTKAVGDKLCVLLLIYLRTNKSYKAPDHDRYYMENDSDRIEEVSSVSHHEDKKHEVAMSLIFDEGLPGQDSKDNKYRIEEESTLSDIPSPSNDNVLILQNSIVQSTTTYYLNMQVYDSRPSQLFKIKRVQVDKKVEGKDEKEDEVYQIVSTEHPDLLLSLTDGNCLDNTNIVLWSQSKHDYAKWKITPGGTIENYYCKDIVIDISSFQARKDELESIDNLDARVQCYKKNDEWGQKWNVQSDMVVLSPIGVTDDDDSNKKPKQNSNQTWTPDFADPGYELALLPGFPGKNMYGDQSCPSSTMDPDLANKAMSICDESMSMLVGSQLSVGTLKEIADLVNEKGANRMPGFCCMDTATNSDFFGFDVS